MLAETPTLDHATIDLLCEQDTLVQCARGLFALLDWSQLDQQQASRPCPGPHPHPECAYLKAFLLKIVHHLPYMTHLRTFLCDHPLLMLELGFRLVPDASQLYGFDVQRTVPSDRWVREQLHRLDPRRLASLLGQTVHALQEEIPGWLPAGPVSHKSRTSPVHSPSGQSQSRAPAGAQAWALQRRDSPA